MNKIIFPLNPEMRGEAVANLQDGLRLLLEKNAYGLNDSDRQGLDEQLSAERTASLYGSVTRKLVRIFQEKRQLEPSGAVDERTANAINALLIEFGAFPERKPRVIRGQVMSDSRPIENIEVIAYDRDLGSSRQQLGEPAVTKADGSFEIRYKRQQFASGEGEAQPGGKETADLIFELKINQVLIEAFQVYRVFPQTTGAAPMEQLVSADDLRLGIEARAEEVVRIVILPAEQFKEPAEYDRLMALLRPVLVERKPNDLNEEEHRDISFVVRETGIERERLEEIVAAWQLAQATRNANPNSTLDVPKLAEWCYGLLRDGAPTTIPAATSELATLVNAGEQSWKEKLDESIKLNLISKRPKSELIDELNLLRIRQADKPIAEGRASLSQVLGTVKGLTSNEARDEFLLLYQKHEDSLEEFWSKVVPEKLGWEPERIRQVQTAVQFADLTGFHLPLMEKIQQRFTSLKELARLNRDALQELVKSTPFPGDIADSKKKQKDYFEGLHATLQANFPTLAVANLIAEVKDKGLKTNQGLLQEFFRKATNHDDDSLNFDLSQTSFNDYWDKTGKQFFSEEPAEKQEDLQKQLKRIQRTFQLSTNPEQMTTLLNLKLDSAARITSLSREMFVTSFAEKLGGDESAAAVYARAASINAMTTNLLVDLKQVGHDALPMVMRSPDEDLNKIKQLPSYISLFGRLELCPCQHCRSVYSPAAYLVDLLHFLDGPQVNKRSWSPLDVLLGNRDLLGRRPDLAHIQLTCENTNNRIPYIDLVNEILESFIAQGEKDRVKCPFNMPPVISPEPTEEELAANPVTLTELSGENANLTYQKLQDAVYPLSLPYNLHLNTSRLYLNHLGVSREKLLRTLRSEVNFVNITAMAAETIGLSPQEFELITGDQFDGSSSTPAKTLPALFGFSEAVEIDGTGIFIANLTTPLLRENDPRKNEVRSLQNTLNLLGAKLVVNGIYDNATVTAVTEFQQANRIGAGSPSGKVDDLTWGALEGKGYRPLSVQLSYVPTFLARIGITYNELVELLKLPEFNPEAREVDFLTITGITLREIGVWMRSGFPRLSSEVLAKLEPVKGLLTGKKTEEQWLQAWAEKHRDLIIINTPQEDSCDLDRTFIERLDGGLLSPDQLRRINCFIRLWRRLGWSLKDAARAWSFDTKAIKSIIALADAIRVQRELQLDPTRLMCLWKGLDVIGRDSTYARLFQNKSAQKLDAIFDLNLASEELKAVIENDPAKSPKLSAHKEAIQAAFRVTEPELDLLRKHLGLVDIPKAEPKDLLTLYNLSALYRYVLLSKSLSLKIVDLIALEELSGLTPFDDKAENQPLATLKFIELVRAIRQSGFSIPTLNFIYRHRSPNQSELANRQSQITQVLKTLRDGLSQIEAEHQQAVETTGELCRAKLAILINDGEVVTKIISLITGECVFTKELDLRELPDSLKRLSSLSEKISFVPPKNKSKGELRFTGVMTTADKVTINRTISKVTAAKRNQLKSAFEDLYNQPREFLTQILRPFLQNPDEAIKKLLDTPPKDKPVLAKKFNWLLKQLIPHVKQQRKETLLIQTLLSSFGLDPSLCRSLLLNNKLLHSLKTLKANAIDDFDLISGDGLVAAYFDNRNLDGTAVKIKKVENINESWGSRVPVPRLKQGNYSVSWTGYVLADYSEEYTFSLKADDGIRLWIGDKLLIDSWKAQPQNTHKEKIKLQSGTFYPVKLEYFQQNKSSVISLSWSSASIRERLIPQENMYTGSAIERMAKVALLVNGFALKTSELEYFSDNQKLFDDFDLNKLSVHAAAKYNPSIFEPWRRLLAYCDLRETLTPGDSSLIEVFSAKSPEAAERKLLFLTGWNADELKTLIATEEWKSIPDDFRTEKGVVWLASCFALMKRLGVSAQRLLDWSTIVYEDTPKLSVFLYTTPADNRSIAIAQGIKNVVRSNYDQAVWLGIAKPLNNVLRDQRRDAMVQYILSMPDVTSRGITDSNRLYEYLLIDVEVSPCAETSRIKQAISSVQMFIERCLMNLENFGAASHFTVAPSQIDRHRWEWMKRYRVWEANRKIFLYPENWIEPELRDDKSPFFKELESELLQAEVTNEAAEEKVMNYLEKLDEVARLDICGTCEDNATQELHVFGRTFNSPPHYFYRKLNMNTQVWTAWEPVPLDIQGNEEGDSAGVHLIPVIWNGRLHLFWPVFTEKPDREKLKDDKLKSFPWAYYEVRLAWSEYRQHKWSKKRISQSFIWTFPYKDGVGEKSCFRFLTQLDSKLTIKLLYQPYSPSSPKYQALYIAEFRIHFNGNVTATYEKIYNVSFQFMAPKQLTFYQSYLAATETIGAIQWNQNASLPLILLSNSGKKNYELLYGSESEYKVLFPADSAYASNSFPNFIYQDQRRNYYVENDTVMDWPDRLRSHWEIRILDFNTKLFASPKLSEGMSLAPSGRTIIERQIRGTTLLQLSTKQAYPLIPAKRRSKFNPFFHAYVGRFMEALNASGIDGLLTLQNQQFSDWQFTYKPGGIGGKPIPVGVTNTFEIQYLPRPNVTKPYPAEEVDFSPGGAYSLYNWELFFHIPMLIAKRLSSSQRFREAQQWYHYIFNPTSENSEPSPERYWNFLPFKTTEARRIDRLLRALSSDSSDPATKTEVEKQIKAWQESPFRPHLIARMRPGAYMKNVVMRYIDNLIAWGDQLFRQDTLETINEATLLYVLAANMLGPRPEQMPNLTKQGPQTFEELRKKLDQFSNALVETETLFPLASIQASPDASTPLTPLRTLYFCIPQNDQLLEYWDTVADRLFKIRNCMNMEGVVRKLPLFEPQIDPALLVQAVAQGIDINSVMRDLNAPLPRYRFNFMLQKALELCNEVKSLGASLLAAIEKKEAEELARIRSRHEKTLLGLVRTVKAQQIKEAQESRAGLEKSKAVIEVRQTYYEELLKQGLIDSEREQLGRLAASNKELERAAELEILAQLAHLIPNYNNPQNPNYPSFIFGGANLGLAANAFARHYSEKSSNAAYEANRASITAGHTRRAAEWELQRNLAKKELLQIDKQILVARIREAILEKELENHDKQIEHAEEVDDFLRREKYSNQELYAWMESKVSALHSQSYQLAYDLAKQAERTFRFERGISNSNYIQYGVWDSLRNGLLSGEQLSLQLRQMERAYLAQNRREYELTKHVSLLLHDPLALIQLKETGSCEITLPEEAFDADYSGHYMRRLKNVSISIPAVVGPYTGVNCTLTLLGSSIRCKEIPVDPYPSSGFEDARFVFDPVPIQSIATSSGQNDSGMFEINFRDERYLPFEGAGAISHWRIDLPKENNNFDLNTVSDVILHIRYTALEGGDMLRKVAGENLITRIEEAQAVGSVRLFSIRHEFPAEWAKFKTTTQGAGSRFELFLNLRKEHYPFWSQGRLDGVERVDIFARSATKQVPSSLVIFDKASDQPVPDVPANKDTLAKDPAMNNLLIGKFDKIPLPQNPVTELKLYFESKDIEDLWIVITWKGK